MKKTSINTLIDEVERCIDNKDYIGAFIIALIIPDACANNSKYAKNRWPGDNHVRAKYIWWYNTYVKEKEDNNESIKNIASVEEIRPYMDGDAIYKIRNMFLHEGSDEVNPYDDVDIFRIMYSDNAISMFKRPNKDGKIYMQVTAPYLSRIIIFYAKKFLESDDFDIENIKTATEEGLTEEFIEVFVKNRAK